MVQLFKSMDPPLQPTKKRYKKKTFVRGLYDNLLFFYNLLILFIRIILDSCQSNCSSPDKYTLNISRTIFAEIDEFRDVVVRREVNELPAKAFQFSIYSTVYVEQVSQKNYIKRNKSVRQYRSDPTTNLMLLWHSRKRLAMIPNTSSTILQALDKR